MRTHKSSALPGPVILTQEESVESILGKEDELWGEMKGDMKILIHSSPSGFVVTKPTCRVAGGKGQQQNKEYLQNNH